MKAGLPYPIADRRAILRVLLDKRTGNSTFHTFEKIKDRTGLNIQEVMLVTGHFPYDIIGTVRGYKHISRAADGEIEDAIGYNASKIKAMRYRTAAFRQQLAERV